MWISSSRRSLQSLPDAEPADLRVRRLLALVVGEDPGLRRMVRTHLEAIRLPGDQSPGVLSVMEAESGRAALSVVSAIAPALVVLDLILPELSGYEVCERLRASTALQHVPILAVLSLPLLVRALRASELGASGQQRAIAMIDLETAQLHATFGLLLVLGLVLAALVR